MCGGQMMSNFCQRETKVNISRFINLLLLLINVDTFQFDAVVYIISPNSTNHTSHSSFTYCGGEKLKNITHMIILTKIIYVY